MILIQCYYLSLFFTLEFFRFFCVTAIVFILVKRQLSEDWLDFNILFRVLVSSITHPSWHLEEPNPGQKQVQAHQGDGK